MNTEDCLYDGGDCCQLPTNTSECTECFCYAHNMHFPNTLEKAYTFDKDHPHLWPRMNLGPVGDGKDDYRITQYRQTLRNRGNLHAFHPLVDETDFDGKCTGYYNSLYSGDSQDCCKNGANIVKPETICESKTLADCRCNMRTNIGTAFYKDVCPYWDFVGDRVCHDFANIAQCNYDNGKHSQRKLNLSSILVSRFQLHSCIKI